MLFDQVNREHIIQAIKEIDQHGIVKGAHSSTYDVVYNNKRYPPKLVVSLANKYANGKILPRDSFKGGENTPAFQLLESLGFKIDRKLTSQSISMKNIKNEFVNWLIDNPRVNYYNNDAKKLEQELNRYNKFFDIDIFDANNLKGIKSFLNNELYVKNSSPFLEFSERTMRHLPRAVLGKKNYFEFLDEKLRNGNSKISKDIQKLYDLKNAFLKEWPIDRLKSMTLEEYTNLDKETSFCYWLEAITSDLGSIWGGSAYKFGIYKRRELESDNYNKRRKSDGEYAWYGKYGDTKDEVFENIRKNIINIAAYSQQNKLKEIDEIDLGDAVKWKIAFLYGDFNIINMFNKYGLKRVVLGLGLELPESESISDLNQLILNQKPKDEDFFEYSIRVWNAYGIENDKTKEFEKWLRAQKTTNSGMISSYLRAINILINHFEIAVYEEEDIEVLNDLYEDLKLNQKDTNGKYYYAKAKSYGEGGFYSAAVKLYIDFLNQDQESDYNQNGDNDFIASINAFSNDELLFYFNFLDEIVNHLSLKQGDERVVYTCGYRYLNLTIGQRFVWRLKHSKGKKFWIMTAEKLGDDYESFDGPLQHYHTKFSDKKELNINRASCFEAITQELSRSTLSGYKKFNNPEFERAVFDKSFRSQFIKTEKMKENNAVLNKILFGPPGTGKTFNTVNEALKIVAPDFYAENKKNRNALNKRFKELLIKNWDNTNGQIAFCTFHQSFSYEDFVEGIKPKTNENKEVFYEIEDGVFKKICQLADSSISAVKMKKEGKLSWSEEQFNKAIFYKLSLGDSNKSEDKEIYEYCRDNNYIAIGFGGGLDFTGMSESEIKDFCLDTEELGESHAQPLNYFIYYLKVGSYVIISNGNKFVRALGKVTGEYEFDANAPIRYSHFRKVEWLFKDENIPVEELYNRGFSQQTLYKLDEQGLKKDFFVNHGQLIEPESKKVKDYVLIIDEINRGNVSSIFGELITLIEKDKRAGGTEELEVTLPYSKDPFKVPHNVYIVGTMNTADRSIEALDTALRRRFSFDEKPPKPELILTEGSSGKVNGLVDGINLKDLLITINNRIEKLIDKDHKIGHSYFLKVNDLPSLKKCFENEVIPLLEEYFFGDYGKIGLVLGDSFVTKDDSEAFEFAKFEGYDSDVSSDLKERSVYKISPSKNWDFNMI
ncbi:AAA family ATPase [Yeosuana sp. MJ-SS3]|uniref:AAA family ATPase n=1 Tax=Gilvirhabdus luticola TaxID=3079858 RepID=A0ABU3U7D8_9FLAO|nr:AAA family ATPase [Yeosuana sp. MJ-SS3]MDU8886311.1 AAA family ATPase [Yeosuana sp. MJ-SS3]